MERKRLEADARRKLAEGDIEGALQVFQELEIRHQHEPHWSRQVAGLQQRLNRVQECVDALERAAARCEMRREPLKAMAASKMILAIDPAHRATLDRIGRILGPRPPVSSAIPGLIDDLVLPNSSASLAVLPLIRSQPQWLDEETKKTLVRPLTANDFADETKPQRPPRAEDRLTPDAMPPVPLFSGLGNDAVTSLLNRSRLFEAAAGEVLFREGDPGDSLFIVVDGRVSVWLERTPRVRVAELEDGEFFGEIALFTDRPRGATVEAVERTELLTISRDVIMDLVQSEPAVLSELLRFLRDRLVHNVLQTSELFRQFSAAERAKLGAAFTLIDVGFGATLVREGESPSGLYIVVDGSFEVTRSVGDENKVITQLSTGHVFGEISSLTLLPAVASVSAKESGLLLWASQTDLPLLIRDHPRLLSYAAELASARMSELETLTSSWARSRAQLL